MSEPEKRDFEPWKEYRGVMIYRKHRRTSADGRDYWEYAAIVPTKVPAVSIPVHGHTQQSIRLQVGRVLNGLDPVDCSICVHRIPATPISPDRCGLGEDEYGEPWSCTGFEVRV